MSNVSCSLDQLSSVQMSMAFSPFILFLLAEHGQGVNVLSYLQVFDICLQNKSQLKFIYVTDFKSLMHVRELK